MDETLEKLKILIPQWIKHNREHIEKTRQWLAPLNSSGFKHTLEDFQEVIRLQEKANHLLEGVNRAIQGNLDHHHKSLEYSHHQSYHFHPIGVIRTPYSEKAPHRPEENAEGDFRIVVFPDYVAGLERLGEFSHIIILFLFDRSPHPVSLKAHPPHAPGLVVGTFASRSPVRPNPIGLSIAKLKSINGNELYTSGLDILDGTPLLDLKPYIQETDSKPEANNGWLDTLERNKR